MYEIMKKIYLYSIIVLLTTGLITFFAFKNSSVADSKGYGVGDKVANFSLKSVSGKMISMNTDATIKGYILVFTCNHCPFSKAYESRILDLDKKYATKGYPVLAINPNDPTAYEEDSFENMVSLAKSKNYSFEYLHDESQSVAKAFGASRTPSTFIVKKEGTSFVMSYIGAIDDNSQDTGSVSKKYVEDAVNNLLSGKPVVVNTTKAIGCAIKWRAN